VVFFARGSAVRDGTRPTNPDRAKIGGVLGSDAVSVQQATTSSHRLLSDRLVAPTEERAVNGPKADVIPHGYPP